MSAHREWGSKIYRVRHEVVLTDAQRRFVMPLPRTAHPVSRPTGPVPAGPARAERLIGVVLAAGAGTRYGVPKVLAEQGEWLANAVAALADGGCDDVFVMLGAAIVEVPAPAHAVVVPRWADGLSASVRAGLETAIRAGGVGVVLLVVDVPDTSAAAVRRVVGAVRSRPSGLARAVFGGRPGHPVYIGADHVADVLATVTGDRGAAAYIDRRPEVIRVECGDLASGSDRDHR